MALPSVEYAPRDPGGSVLQQIVREHFETFRAEDGCLAFHATPSLTKADVAEVLAAIAPGVTHLLERRGFGDDGDRSDTFAEVTPLLAGLAAASVQGVVALGRAPGTRSCPGGAPAVWRSENGGDSWNRLARGLPKKQSYFTVLRDAMDIDRLRTPALYFGTTTGQLWIGREGGEQWDCLFDSLPPIHNVKVAVV